MSHSVVKDFPTQTDSTLILVVNKNGELSVDKETLDGYAKLGNSQVSILRVENDDGSTVDMTLDTFHQTDNSMMDALSVSVEEDELTRNYNNFRMDHCYTPLTSPSQQKAPIPPDLDAEFELDDLAQTLSILDGHDKPSDQIAKPAGNIKHPQKTIEKEQRINTSSDKVQVLNKVNKIGVHKVYKSVKTLVKGASKVFKKAEPPPQLESDPDDDDLNDSDFELNESPNKLKNKRNYNRRRSKQDSNEISNEMRNKVVKVRKGVKHIVYKPHTPSKTTPTLPESKPEPSPPSPITQEPIKSPESKKIPKKEKKAPKVVDDGIALFSTPDIIRRVGSGKLDNPESPSKVSKPARIEDRSKSESGRLSTDAKNKSQHRHSLDSKMEKSRHSERRASNASDKSSDNTLDSNLNAAHVTNSDHMQSTSADNDSFDSISEAVGNLENDIDPTPSTEMMRSIIHTNEMKSYSTNVEPSIINPIASAVEQAQLSLEGTGLDIDQGILDNINTDELIPEDILYQVAKLVENPDVQNVIDRTLVGANLSLDTGLQPQIPQQVPAPTIQQQPTSQHIVTSITQATQQIDPNQQVTKNTTQRPIQIVRSDGRVVILPPIEKPETRSSKKKQEVPSQPQPQVQQPPKPQQLQQIPHVILQQQKIHHARPVPKQIPVADELPEEAVGSDIESDSDESWNSEDDPDRLWCICKQPHNNRFMICCDTCEDWFHGKCVNVTKAMGQQMEQQGKEWMCPNCVKKVNSPAGSTPVSNSPSFKAAKVSTESISKRKSVDSGPACIVCGSPSRANSVYCSDSCILKHAQGVEKETNKAQKNINQRIIVFERSTGKCLSGPNAPTAANLKQWLREHPGFEVVRPAAKSKQQNLVQSKLQLVKNPHGKEGVGLAVNRKGMQLGVLPHSKQQQSTIKLIPPSKLPSMKNQAAKSVNTVSPNKPVKTIQTTLKSPTASTSQIKPKPTTPTISKAEKRERKQKLLANQTPEPKQQAPENIRDTVKKTLNEQLTTRLKEVEDIKLTEDEVEKMATEIESQLYKLFGDSGPKYRTKYRSLIFNIKDTKNQTLWRRICEKTIAPAQLVRLTPDEMASQELARWRERENKHQLDMIKKSELEMLTINRTYVLKTHKGEQVMEDRPSVKVDSTEIMPGLGADSTSEQDSGTGDKSEKDEHSLERKNSAKHSRKDRDRDKRSSKDRSTSKDRRSRDHKSSRSKRSRSREKDRDRSSHRSDRKRSRSRDRHHRSSHKSSRHRREKHITEHLDKKSREILDNLENNKIVPPPEDRLWKHVPQQDILVATPDSDSDHEPSSTVTIPTPPRSFDQDESQNPAAKQPETSSPLEAPAEKIEQKTETIMQPVRADPRLTREASVETPKSESPPQPTTPVASTSPVPPAPAKFTSESKESIIWEGNINMVDVAKFFITLHEVSGDCSGLRTELPSTLEIVGRISPETVWDYIGKMRRSNSKLISVLRLTARNVEEKMPYIALYSYLSSRSRFGVIKSTNSAVKDFYIMPLASHTPVPQALLPLSGPGFEESRPPLLLGIIVRAKRKRSSTVEIVPNSTTKRSRIDSPTTPVVAATQPARSYTPPPARDPRIRLPTVPATPSANDDDEPYSPEDSDAEMPTATRKSSSSSSSSTSKPAPAPAPAIVAAAASALNIKTADLTSLVTATLKSNTFLDTAAVQSFEPFSNKFEGIPGLDVDTGVDSLQRKMAELDKCIEKQKEEIRNISQDIASSNSSVATNLSNISLPSNLQQILDSIKNIPSTNSNSQDASTEEYCPTAPGYKTATPGSDELTIPLLLPKLSSRHSTVRAPAAPQLSAPVEQKPTQVTSTIPLQLPVVSRESTPAAAELTIPNLSVPPPSVSAISLSAAIAAPTITLPNTNIPPPVLLPNLTVPPPSTVPSSSSTIPLNLPKPKSKPTPAPAPVTPVVDPLTPPGTAPVVIPPSAESKPSSVLSSLSEEELIRKAAEMLGEAEPALKEEEEEEEKSEDKKKAPEKNYQTQNAFKSAPVLYSPSPVAPTPPKRTKIDVSQPPVPGLEDEEF